VNSFSGTMANNSAEEKPSCCISFCSQNAMKAGVVWPSKRSANQVGAIGELRGDTCAGGSAASIASRASITCGVSFAEVNPIVCRRIAISSIDGGAKDDRLTALLKVGFFVAFRCPSENARAPNGFPLVNSTGSSSADAGRSSLGREGRYEVDGTMIGRVDIGGEGNWIGGGGWAAENHCVTSSSEGGTPIAYTSVQNLHVKSASSQKIE